MNNIESLVNRFEPISLPEMDRVSLLRRTDTKYLLNIIKAEYEKKSKADQVLVEYLNILENTYLNLKSTVKSED